MNPLITVFKITGGRLGLMWLLMFVFENQKENSFQCNNGFRDRVCNYLKQVKAHPVMDLFNALVELVYGIVVALLEWNINVGVVSKIEIIVLFSMIGPNGSM